MAICRAAIWRSSAARKSRNKIVHVAGDPAALLTRLGVAALAALPALVTARRVGCSVPSSPRSRVTARWHAEESAMLLPLQGRRIAYDLVGPADAPTVCITHSLASDGGSWAEQVPPLLQAGFRVLRLDMRGHGGSDPVAGDYTMRQLADDVASVLEALAIPRVHYIGLSIGGMIGQAFALEHGDRLISAMWCDTLPASPRGAAATSGTSA